jgi:hypothetical protein
MRLMRSSGRIFLGCVATLVAILAGGWVPAGADDGRRLVLDYQMLLGPLPIMTVAAELALPSTPAGSGPYRAHIVGRADPTFGRVYDWSFTARSEGAAAAHVKPRRFAGENLSILDRRPVAIAYASDGSPTTRFEPPQPQDKAIALPPGQVKGSIDPASALVQFVRRVATGGSCATTLPIYDGRRRFDLVAEDAGEELIGALPGSVYSGPAARCALRLMQRDASRERLPTEGTAWIAAIGDGPRVPVRIEFLTPTGPMVLDLVRIEPGSGS